MKMLGLVGEVFTGIEIAWAVARGVAKLTKARKKRTALIKEGKVIIICSCQHPRPKHPPGRQVLWRIKGFNQKGNPIWDHATLCESSLITGIHDAFSLAHLGLFFGSLGIDHELRTDVWPAITPVEKSENNLFLIGSPASNAVSEKLCPYIPPAYFKYENDYKEMVIRDTDRYSEKEDGIVIKLPNPFGSEDTKKVALLMAGIGPDGTEAAARFVVEKVHKLPRRIRNSAAWIVRVKAEVEKGFIVRIRAWPEVIFG